VTLHDAVPLHERVLQVSLVQAIGVPAQEPAVQVSLNVHACPSLHPVPVRSWVWHCPVEVLHEFTAQGFVDAGQLTVIAKVVSLGTSLVSLQKPSPFTLFTQRLNENVPQLLLAGVYVNGNETTPPEFGRGAACMISVLPFDVPKHGNPSDGAQACS
jgi:hypothetical protein